MDLLIVLTSLAPDEETYRDLYTTLNHYDVKHIILIHQNGYCVAQSGSCRCFVHGGRADNCLLGVHELGYCVHGEHPDAFYEDFYGEDD
jgi:hypothetical protein